MAVTANVFAAGTMPSSLTVVYTVPGASQAIMSYASFHNTTGGSITITMVFHTVVDVVILDFALGADETFVFKEKPVLETGTTIKLQASSGSSVDYWISGGIVA